MAERRALIAAPLYANVKGFSYLTGHSSLVPRLKKCLEENGKYDMGDIELASKNVTRAQFRTALEYFFDSDGELLFYFYGHGCLSAGQGVFVTTNAEEGDEGVSMQQVVNLADTSSAREVVLIFDCCHAGSSIPAKKDSVPKANKAGRVILAACAEHQRGWETESDEHKKIGAFSAHVLDGLEGAARYGKPEVNAYLLGDYVTSQFKSWKQTPIFEVSGGSSSRQFIITSGFPEEKSLQVFGVPEETVDLEWLNRYLGSVQDDFTQHMLPEEKITDEFAERARARYVELLVQERQQAELPEQEDPAERVGSAFPFSEVMRQQNTRFLIYGDGGGGKTTSLRKLASDVASLAQSDPSLPIPVFIKLNDFDATERSFDNLLRIVSDTTNLEQPEFETLWRGGTRKFLFLLDGYNEVGDTFQEACARALRRFVGVGGHHYLITSRPVGRAEQLGKLLDPITVLDVIHLEENQIQDFLARHGAAALYEQMGDQLKGLAQNPFMLWALAQSSALSTEDELPTNIGQLYQTFIDHYIFLERELNKIPSPTEYNYFLVKKPVLASLAMIMNQEGVTKREDNEEFRNVVWDQLKELKERHIENEGPGAVKPYSFMPEEPGAPGFLDETVHNSVLRRAGDTLEFMHQSVQDYFTAVAMSSWTTEKIINQLIDPLVWRHIEVAYYRLKVQDSFFEPIVMLSGLLPDSSDLLAGLISYNPLLAAHCLAPSTNVRPTTMAKAIDSWQKMLDRHHERYRWIACQCFEIARLDQEDVVRQLVEIALHDKVVQVQRAAIRALSAIENEASIRQVVEEYVSWASKGDYVFSSNIHIEDLHSVFAVSALFDAWRNMEKDDSYSNPAARLLASMDRELVRSELQKIARNAREDGNNALRKDAEVAVIKLDSWQRIGIFSASMATKMVRAALSSLLEEKKRIYPDFASMSVSQLIERLRYTDFVIRLTAAEMLGERGKEEAVSSLLDLLSRETDPRVHQAIITALGKFRDRDGEILDFLEQKLHNVESTVLFRVDSKYQADLNTGKISEELQKDFERNGVAYPVEDYAVDVDENQSNWRIRPMSWGGPLHMNPIFSIRKGESDLVVHDDGIRPRVADLGVILGKKAVPALSKALQDDDVLVHEPVITTLGVIGGDEAATSLVEFVQSVDEPSTNSGVLPTAIEALGKTKSNIAINSLIERFKQSAVPKSAQSSVDDSTRVMNPMIGRVANALQELDANPQILNLLENDLLKASRESRLIAIETISFWREVDQQVIDLLHHALRDEDGEVRVAAVEELGRRKGKNTERRIFELCISDPDRTVRQAAAKALRWFDGDSTINELILVLKGTDSEESAAAAEALGLIEDEMAVEPLVVVLEGEAASLRFAAAAALIRLKADVPIDLLQEIFYAPIQDALRVGDNRKAIQRAGDRIPFLPNDANLYWWRAEAYHDLNQFGGALSDYDQVIELLSLSVIPDLHVKRALVLDELNRHEDALVAFRQAAETDSNQADFQASLGWCAYKLGQYEESVAASTRALELGSQSPMVAFNLGLALLVMEQPDKARGAYKQGVKICEGLDVHIALANLSGALGDLDELVDNRSDLKAFVKEYKGLLSTAQQRFTIAGSDDSSS